MIEKIGLIAAIVLPLWNIPLIARMIRRKSSQDMSLWWLLGVWTCILFMVPAGLASSDLIWRTYTYVNTIFFTAVVFVALKYYGAPRTHVRSSSVCSDSPQANRNLGGSIPPRRPFTCFFQASVGGIKLRIPAIWRKVNNKRKHTIDRNHKFN